MRAVLSLVALAVADDSVAKQLAVIVNDINDKIFSTAFLSQVDDINQYNAAISDAADACQAELSAFEALVNLLLFEYNDAQDKKQKALAARVAIDYDGSGGDQAEDMEDEFQDWLDAHEGVEGAKAGAELASGTPATSTVTLGALSSVAAGDDADVQATLDLLKEIVAKVAQVVEILEDVAETSRFTACATALKAQISLAENHMTAHPIDAAKVQEVVDTFEAMDAPTPTPAP